ncbi:40S ribosomal protein S7-2 [Zea mays]|uniref:40S ribosomal protein S7 n=1 Tax=Zea mays TaxID=4577 RepID=A0A1D6E3W8_MAIZE|nr:40S ribosomal protein S7-2 [Zea mays]
MAALSAPLRAIAAGSRVAASDPVKVSVRRRREGKMYTARKKIQKEKGLEPSEFEDSVAQNGNQELKSDLKDLYINNAIQMDVTGSRKAVVIHVPYRLRKAFRKIHVRLVRELEKKFSGKIAAMRCPLPRPPDHSDGAGSGRRWGILLASQVGITSDLFFVFFPAGFLLCEKKQVTQLNKWSLSRVSEFGYARVHATRGDMLVQFVSSSTMEVLDQFRIVKPDPARRLWNKPV